MSPGLKWGEVAVLPGLRRVRRAVMTPLWVRASDCAPGARHSGLPARGSPLPRAWRVG